MRVLTRWLCAYCPKQYASKDDALKCNCRMSPYKAFVCGVCKAWKSEMKETVEEHIKRDHDNATQAA